MQPTSGLNPSPIAFKLPGSEVNVADGTVAEGTDTVSFYADRLFILGTLRQAENQCARSWRKKLASSSLMPGQQPMLATCACRCGYVLQTVPSFKRQSRQIGATRVGSDRGLS
jgi:hypothetical protein